MELEAQRLSLRQKSADNKTSWLPSCGTQSGLSAPVAASNPRDDASSWRRVALRVRAGDGVAWLGLDSSRYNQHGRCCMCCKQEVLGMAVPHILGSVL